MSTAAADPVENARPPTERQLEVMRAIVTLSAEGMPPSLRELADALAIGFTGVRVNLDALAKKGLVVRRFYTPRSVRLTDEGRRVLSEREV